MSLYAIRKTIVYPPTLPQHARRPHIQANGKCGGSCYGHYADTGPFKCSNLYCLGHLSLWSSACYTHRLQPRQRLPLSVFDDLEAVYPSPLEVYIADQSRTSGPAEDPEDDNRDPFVFRRAPRPPVVDYDNDRENLLGTLDEGLHAGPVDAPQSRPAMQETPAERALRRIYATLRRARLADDHVKPANFVPSRTFLDFIRELSNHGNGPLTDSQNRRVEDLVETIFDELAQVDHRDIHAESTTAKVARNHSEAKPTPAEEADMLVKDIVNLIRQEFVSQRSDEQDANSREKKASIAQNRSGANPTPAEEAEQMVEAIKDLVRQERVSEQKEQEVKAFIAQKAAGFAKEERELTEKENFYKLRGPSEDPLPPLASSMEDLMERDAQIEARIRRVTYHEYRNSLVTSTTTPHADNPSKSKSRQPNHKYCD